MCSVEGKGADTVGGWGLDGGRRSLSKWSESSGWKGDRRWAGSHYDHIWVTKLLMNTYLSSFYGDGHCVTVIIKSC